MSAILHPDLFVLSWAKHQVIVDMLVVVECQTTVCQLTTGQSCHSLRPMLLSPAVRRPSHAAASCSLICIH